MPYRWGILRRSAVSPGPAGPRSAVLLRVASDERLVALVRGGSEAAFEAIYDRHHRGILAFCRHMLSLGRRGRGRACSTRSWPPTGISSAASAEIQLRPWLYTIARNRCLSMLRARRERPLDEHHEPATEHLVGRGAAPPGRPRAARRRRRAARGPAGGARARRARRRLPRRDRDGARGAAAEGEGARVPGPHLAGRQPHGARDAVRRRSASSSRTCAAARCGARRCTAICASARAAGRSARRSRCSARRWRSRCR